jgi:hypothetical protein
LSASVTPLKYEKQASDGERSETVAVAGRKKKSRFNVKSRFNATHWRGEERGDFIIPNN